MPSTDETPEPVIVTDSQQISSTPRRRPNVLFQELPDGTGVVVDPASGASIALNVTGAEVWALCDGSHTADDIAAALLKRYDATEAAVKESVTALLAHLRQLGALE